MKRVTLLWLCLAAALFFGAVATTAADAAEEEGGFNWTVNGKPLALKATVKVKATSLTPIKIIVPEVFTIVCQKFSASGTIEGGVNEPVAPGEGGAMTLAHPKLSSCGVDGEPGVRVKVSVPPTYVIKSESDGHWYNPLSWTHKFCIEEPGEAGVWKETGWLGIIIAKGGGHTGDYEGVGMFDSHVTEHGELEFPEEPLPSNSFAVNGHPAVFAGNLKLTLPKKESLGGYSGETGGT